MPAAVWKKRRRASLWRLASRSLISVRRASTSRCCAVCGTGKYSSLDTICVGTGEGNDDVSAGSKPLIISSVRYFMALSPDGAALPGRDLTPQVRPPKSRGEFASRTPAPWLESELHPSHQRHDIVSWRAVAGAENRNGGSAGPLNGVRGVV